ncbi:hypothetical protein F5888DRAFT_1892504 [Russula emetica]|nr:hypothetical protein F5888DRAFT_1892504 [Russula emetica]
MPLAAQNRSEVRRLRPTQGPAGSNGYRNPFRHLISSSTHQITAAGAKLVAASWRIIELLFRLLGSGTLDIDSTVDPEQYQITNVYNCARMGLLRVHTFAAAVPKTRTGTGTGGSEMFGTEELPLFGVRFFNSFGPHLALTLGLGLFSQQQSALDQITYRYHNTPPIADRRNAGGVPQPLLRFGFEIRNSGNSNRSQEIPDIWTPPPPVRITIPPSIFPWSNNTGPINLLPLTETSYHDKSLSLSSIMSLFTLILEALAGTVTLLSAPKLLDRVLTQLSRLLPLGAGIA